MKLGSDLIQTFGLKISNFFFEFEKEIGEVILKSGNAVSTGALASLGFWDIDVMMCIFPDSFFCMHARLRRVR
jgi:hypothetical protein